MDRPRVRRRVGPERERRRRPRLRAGARHAGSLLAPPPWLRDLGVSAWLLAGVAVVTVAGVWLASLTKTIVMPVITAVSLLPWPRPDPVAAAPRAPVVASAPPCCSSRCWCWARPSSCSCSPASPARSPQLSASLASAKDTHLEGWLRDAGVSRGDAAQAKQDASSSVSTALPVLVNGVMGGIEAAVRARALPVAHRLSVFFLMKDGPMIRAWLEDHCRRSAAPRRHHQRPPSSSRCGATSWACTAVAAVNGVVVGARRADPRRPAAGDDRPGHLPRRLHPLPRRVDRGRVRGPARARRRGD